MKSSHFAESLRSRRFLVIAAALVSVAIPIALAYQVRVQIGHGFSDFQGFYGAGKIVASGNGANLYDSATQVRMQRAPKLPGIDTHHYYVHAPFEALLFVPFARLPFELAAWCWWSLGLLFAYAALFVLRPFLPAVQARVEWSLLSVAVFIPIIVTLIEGQDSTLTLLIFSICYVCLVRRHYGLAGGVLAIAMYKPPLALAMIVQLAISSSERLKILTGFLISCVILLLAAVATVGWACVINYPILLTRFPKVAAGHFHIEDMPNLRGLVTPILEGHASERLILAVVVVLSLVLLAVSIWAARKSSDSCESDPRVFALFVATTLLVGFQEYAYDLSLLFVSILLIWNWSSKAELNTPARRMLGYCVVFLLLGSFVVLFSPAVYTCAILFFSALLCRELLGARAAAVAGKEAVQSAV
jgi:hypothetical protein